MSQNHKGHSLPKQIMIIFLDNYLEQDYPPLYRIIPLYAGLSPFMHLLRLYTKTVYRCLYLYLFFTIFNEGAYLTFKSIFHKALSLF